MAEKSRNLTNAPNTRSGQNGKHILHQLIGRLSHYLTFFFTSQVVQAFFHQQYEYEHDACCIFMMYIIRDEMTYNYLTRDEGFLGRETDSDHPTHGEVWSDLLHPRCIVVGRTKHPVQFRRFTMFAPPKLTDSFSKLGLKGFLKTHLNMYFLFWFYTPTIYHITRPWGWAIGHLFSFLASNCDLPTFHPKKKKKRRRAAMCVKNGTDLI